LTSTSSFYGYREDAPGHAAFRAWLQEAEVVRARPNAVKVTPGPRHWATFARLCKQAGAKGNLVPEAYLVALAIESGSEWITTDRDCSRFVGVRWRHASDERGAA
jgi:predicted nucleic acid-binding protein